MQYDIYGVGNAIMDLQIRCEDAFLESAGIDKGMMTLTELKQQQLILDSLPYDQVHYCSGGSAANTIVGVADMGGTAAYAGKTGTDEFGRKYLQEMRDLGIAIEVSPESGATGTCVVLITPDAQRTMLTHLGVSAQLSEADIDAAAIAKSGYVYIEGYLFTGQATRAAALKAIEAAKQHGVKVALTISDPFLVDLCRDEFLRLIKGPVDLLFCNLDEARALTNRTDPIECAYEIHKHAENVALTLGKNGSIIMHKEKAIPIEAVPILETVDTTGAGDMYAAGVLYGITNGFTWQHAGRLGSHAAARIVSQLGARLDRRFTKAEIRQLLE